MFVLHGVNDTLVPVTMARATSSPGSGRSPGATVAYVELPRAQHAFDVLASIRCRHTTMGAVRFLEAVRARSGVETPDGIPGESPTGTPAEISGSKDPRPSTTR